MLTTKIKYYLSPNSLPDIGIAAARPSVMKVSNVIMAPKSPSRFATAK